MCGIAGFVGVAEAHRLPLTYMLTRAIDSRGRHGAGFVAVNGAITHNRKAGAWSEADWTFLSAASHGESVILHSRYGTCGGKSAGEAHPFAIQRDGKVRLYGAHNGVLDNTEASAKAHKRKHDVDSRELFELLADDDYASIQKIEGYGTLAWIRADDPYRVRLVRMTDTAELEVARLEEGGYVFGSTRAIVQEAVAGIGLHVKCFHGIKVGEVFTLHPTAGIEGSAERITLADRYSTRLWNSPASSKTGIVDNDYEYLDLAAEMIEDGCSDEEMAADGWTPREIADAHRLLRNRDDLRAFVVDVDDDDDEKEEDLFYT